MIIHDAFHFFQLREYDLPYSTRNIPVGSRPQAIKPAPLGDGVDNTQGMSILRGAIFHGPCRSENVLQINEDDDSPQCPQNSLLLNSQLLLAWNDIVGHEFLVG